MPIDCVLPLDTAPLARRVIQQGGLAGKIILNPDDNPRRQRRRE
ncbi:hypothetical protein [uncultured Sphingomonas sp.]|nr:hypothetical protein [uncultured Sphingomonas sp.]